MSNRLLTALLLTGAVSAAAAETIPLRLEVPIDVPLRIDLTQEISLDVTAQVGAETVSTSFGGEVDAELLDVYRTLSDTEESGARTVLKWWRSSNGTIEDPPITGAVFLVSVDEEGLTEISIDGDRTIPRSVLNQQLNLSPSLWAWAAFPDEAEVGSSLALDLKPLAALVFGEEFEFDEAAADVTFDAYDAETRRATFSGAVRAAGNSLDEEAPGRAEFTGPITLVTDLGENRIHELRFDGEVAVEGEQGGVSFTGQGRLKSGIRTHLAPDGFEAPTPRHRTAVRKSEPIGLELALPSYYGEMRSTPESFELLRTIDESDGQAIVNVQVIEASSANPKAFFDALGEQLKKDDPTMRLKGVRSPLGNGKAMVVEKEEGGRSFYIRTEFYPWRGKWVAYKLSGDAAACEHALPEYVKARKSLRGSR